MTRDFGSIGAAQSSQAAQPSGNTAREPIYAARTPRGISTQADFDTWTVHIKRGVSYAYFAAGESSGTAPVPHPPVPDAPAELVADRRISIVFVHGTGSNRTRLARVQRTFDAYDRYYPDLPGRQGSAHRGGDTAEDYADAICDFISDIPDVLLVGHSLGGALVAGVLERRPATVRGAVIVGGALDFRHMPPAFIDALRHDRLDMSLAYGTVGPEDEYAFAHVGPDPETEAVQLQDWKADAGLDFGGPEGLAALARVTVPVALVSGREDHIVPWEKSDEIARAIPGAEHVVLNGIGHMVPLMWPEQIRHVVDGVAERIRRGW
ncbi:alpha/beta fold hydrolase [Pseudoscardovia radai]|uniref:alpha/beta fold hydrolase n=1 Tax=Pseudoscardovia radai TaxID=987066 RepID=UPI0039921961